MKPTGHKTESVYRRYAIVAEADLPEAGIKLAALSADKPSARRVAMKPTRSSPHPLLPQLSLPLHSTPISVLSAEPLQPSALRGVGRPIRTSRKGKGHAGQFGRAEGRAERALSYNFGFISVTVETDRHRNACLNGGLDGI